VLALTNDDEVNLAVTMSAVLLRPDVTVLARTASPVIADRMSAFGRPAVINPFDRYGDQLLLSLRAPASHQLMTWLEGGPGTCKPARGEPPQHGRWVICGHGRFGRELTSDLRTGGLDVTVLDTTAPHDRVSPDHSVLVGDAADPELLARADLGSAVGFVAGTSNDIANLSLLAAARAAHPDLFLAARQNEATSAPLFQAMSVDSLLVPTELIAHQVYAQLSTPLLWRFLQEMPQQGNGWAADLVSRLEEQCGEQLEALSRVSLTSAGAPALAAWLAGGSARLGDLLRSAADRSVALHVVPLLIRRGADCMLAPAFDVDLCPGDELLLAGRPEELGSLEKTLTDASTAEYVIHGRRVPASWIWRRLSR
jgi:Trk K+ transport system NAD-binding subunit